jgi:hypothetical protein
VNLRLPLSAALVFENDVGGAIVPVPVHCSGGPANKSLISDLADIRPVNLAKGQAFGFVPFEPFQNFIVCQAQRKSPFVIARAAWKI